MHTDWLNSSQTLSSPFAGDSQAKLQAVHSGYKIIFAGCFLDNICKNIGTLKEANTVGLVH